MKMVYADNNPLNRIVIGIACSHRECVTPIVFGFRYCALHLKMIAYQIHLDMLKGLIYDYE